MFIGAAELRLNRGPAYRYSNHSHSLSEDFLFCFSVSVSVSFSFSLTFLLHACTLSLSLLLFLLLFLPLFLPLLREATTLATYQPTASTAGTLIVCWTRQPPSLPPMHRLQRAGGAAPQGAAPQACSVHQTCGRLVDASAPPASAPGRAPHRRGRRRLAPQDGRAGSP